MTSRCPLALLAGRTAPGRVTYQTVVRLVGAVFSANQGHGNATARALQVYRGGPIDQPALLEIFRAVIANNRAGGWRRIRASST